MRHTRAVQDVACLVYLQGEIGPAEMNLVAT